MTELKERTSVLETKVENIEQKLIEFKQEVKEDTKEIKETLKQMADNSTNQHKELGIKLNEIERNKAWAMGAIAVLGPIAAVILTKIDWATLFTK